MSKRTPKIEIYKAKDGWRWRLRASNGPVSTTQEALAKAIELLSVSQ